MHKAFRYLLLPTKSQATKMLKTLEECRWLYNHLLEQRQVVYRTTGVGLTFYDQNLTLPALKLARPSLASVHSQVLQDVSARIDLAFKAFFRRVKTGEKPGYPRFRGYGRYDSFRYPQAPSGCKVGRKSIHLSKIGDVRIVLHRQLEGKPKTVCIHRTPTGKWFASVSCEVDTEPLPISGEQVGIDVGLATFATLSNGDMVDNPRFFRRDEMALAKAQRRLSKAKNGSADRKRCKKIVSRIYERITNRRKNFAHQESRKIVDKFGFIAVEDLNISRMVHNHCLSKSIMDAAWSEFAYQVSYKAESAGRESVAVNPAYTSQDCSACGHRQVMPLSSRTYECSCCGLSIDRDLNASKNILARGLASIGTQSVKAARLLADAE